MDMVKAIRETIRDGDAPVIESFTLPPRPARYAPVPEELADSPVGGYLAKRAGDHPGLWYHQSIALAHLAAGRNVVVSTGTASGKSLIFQSSAFNRVLCDPDARILVFYPLKALAADQLRGWREMAEALGLDEDAVGRVDGSVPMDLRHGILERSRVVIMTPDVCHAWLMRELGEASVRRFLRSIRMVILDEAHTMDGVFGSNFAFLFRRLLSARRHLLGRRGADREIQLVAATATIANPEAHLTALTGLPMTHVAPSEDGSPQAGRYCAHVAPPPGDEIDLARTLHTLLLTRTTAGAFITFIDSRKGVESLTRASQADLKEASAVGSITPYRAGYDSADRARIESGLQAGTLRGVVSTSALELGIDLPNLVVGINIGVPATRKAYRQRLGRIARTDDGAFLIIAPDNAFTRYGTSFREYHDLSVEPSFLYLKNRFMQFAHGRCLVDELSALGAQNRLPDGLSWPRGFGKIFSAASPGGDRPPELDAMARMGQKSPQRAYPLRNVGEINFKISRGAAAPPIGTVTEAQALRECYPGATYLHLARAYEVVAWYPHARPPYIKVRPDKRGRGQTRPNIRVWVNAGITPADILARHIKLGEEGFLAECKMQITERVNGFVNLRTGEYISYLEMREENPAFRPPMRSFRTSGVVLRIPPEWHKDDRERRLLTRRLLEVFCREYSILPQDVGASSASITVRSEDGRSPRTGCSALFDQTYGSLRLTERVFLDFPHLLERLAASAAADGDAAGQRLAVTVERIQEAWRKWRKPAPPSSAETKRAEAAGYIQVFSPGSTVCLKEKGGIGSDVEIVRPTMVDGNLMYQVKAGGGPEGLAPLKRWVNARFLEPSAGDDGWAYAWWNPATQAYQTPTAKG